MRTFVLRHRSHETDLADEFRYLTSWVDREARRAAQREARRVDQETGGEAVILDEPAEAAAALAAAGPEDRLLLLAHDRLLVGERSLAALHRAVSEGACAAATWPLAATELAARPVYTLRGFERLEEAALAGQGLPPDDAAAPAPLLLVPVSELERRAPEGLPALAHEPAGLTRLAAGLPPARRGLHHEFIDYYGEVRSDVLPHLPAGIRRVLEVGCGRGVTGELLRRELGCEVVGVELNPLVARQAAERLDRVVTGDVEELTLDSAELGGPFDLVLALELFEHLASPERFLATARRLLAPGGAILLSTPNVGHHSVVLDLLAGRWDYLPIGLLCYTHLRFFTKKTLEDWLTRLGFDDFDLVAQTTEEAPETDELARVVPVDRESLRTKGFWVRIRV